PAWIPAFAGMTDRRNLATILMNSSAAYLLLLRIGTRSSAILVKTGIQVVFWYVYCGILYPISLATSVANRSSATSVKATLRSTKRPWDWIALTRISMPV